MTATIIRLQPRFSDELQESIERHPANRIEVGTPKPELRVLEGNQ